MVVTEPVYLCNVAWVLGRGPFQTSPLDPTSVRCGVCVSKAKAYYRTKDFVKIVMVLIIVQSVPVPEPSMCFISDKE